VIYAVLVILSLTLIPALVAIYRLHRKNGQLEQTLVNIQAKISQHVEERLLSHAKYCAEVDAKVKSQLAAEEAKWRELIAAAGCRVKGVLNQWLIDMEGQNQKAVAQAATKLEKDFAEVIAVLEKHKIDFKGLLDAAYIEQYEKMRRNPPRPKKGPRKKVNPPSRYRSLDDDFCCEVPPAEKK
jgi:hypothetical protein